jgi:CubicO group peptidase (beta-lactamase class C family)
MSLSRRKALAALAAAALPFRAAAAPRDAFGAALDRARGFDQLHSLVVAHDGAVVVSEAVRGPATNRPVNVKSVSKTVVAALTGVAIARGLVDGPDQPLVELMSRRIPSDAQPGVSSITVDHLLTMRAGLERTSGRNYGAWVQSGNWVADALRRPFVAEPGGQFLYSTGSFHLLGAALAEASGESLLTLARQWLGAPLGIDIPPWTRDPQGFYMGGNNMALSPLGLVRFGEAYRLAGQAGDPGVIPPGWVEASWTPRTRSPWSGHQYGYGWFLAETGGERVAYARGYGGQMLYVVPSRALTVAITSDPTRPARSRGYAGDLHALLAETIIPAVG